MKVSGDAFGNHPTVEVVGDKVYVAYGHKETQDAKENVVVEMYQKVPRQEGHQPQSCGEGATPTPTPTPTVTPMPQYYEPPVNVIFNVHMEPFAPVPLPQRQQEYQARRQELELPLQWAETLRRRSGQAYGIELTIKAGGEFVEFCLDSGECGENPPSGLFADLRAQGVEVGTHWHTQYQRGRHDWPDVPQPDDAAARRIVTDNRSMVDRVIGQGNNKAAGGIASYPKMQHDWPRCDGGASFTKNSPKLHGLFTSKAVSRCYTLSVSGAKQIREECG